MPAGQSVTPVSTLIFRCLFSVLDGSCDAFCRLGRKPLAHLRPSWREPCRAWATAFHAVGTTASSTHHGPGATMPNRSRMALESSVVWRGAEPSGIPASIAPTVPTSAGSAPSWCASLCATSAYETSCGPVSWKTPGARLFSRAAIAVLTIPASILASCRAWRREVRSRCRHARSRSCDGRLGTSRSSHRRKRSCCRRDSGRLGRT